MWNTQQCNERCSEHPRLAGWPHPTWRHFSLEVPQWCQRVPHSTQAGEQLFLPRQWDVTLEVPHQVQSHCLQQKSNACWREQWENVFVHTSCLTCPLPSCLVTQHCSKNGFSSWSYSSLLSLLFLGFPSFLARISFLVSSYVLFWSSFPSSPFVISFNLCAAPVQCLNFPHFILHPISHFYGSLVLLPLSPPQLSSGSSRFLAFFFFLPTLCLSLKI